MFPCERVRDDRCGIDDFAVFVNVLNRHAAVAFVTSGEPHFCDVLEVVRQIEIEQFAPPRCADRYAEVVVVRGRCDELTGRTVAIKQRLIIPQPAARIDAGVVEPR